MLCLISTQRNFFKRISLNANLHRQFDAYAGIFLCKVAQILCIFIEKNIKKVIITVGIAEKLSNVVKKQKYRTRNLMYNAIVLKIAKRKGAAGL